MKWYYYVVPALLILQGTGLLTIQDLSIPFVMYGFTKAIAASDKCPEISFSDIITEAFNKVEERIAQNSSWITPFLLAYVDVRERIIRAKYGFVSNYIMWRTGCDLS